MLYLFPTKALAQDQLAELKELAKTLPDMRMFTYDGDTPQDARRVGARAGQPRADQPGHAALRASCRTTPSGRTSSRTCATWSSTSCTPTAASSAAISPTCCGGSSASAGTTAARRSSSWPPRRSPTRASWPSGSPARRWSRSTESGAPTGEKTFVCYNPPVVNPELGIRAPYLGEAAKLAARFLKQKIATIVFAPEPARHRGAAGLDQAGGRGQDGRLRHRARLPRRLPAAAPARGRAGAALGRGAGRGDHERARAGDRHRASRRGGARRLSRHHRLACGSRPGARAGAPGSRSR